MPTCTRSSQPKRVDMARIGRARSGGRIEQNSSMPGLRNSATAYGCPASRRVPFRSGVGAWDRSWPRRRGSRPHRTCARRDDARPRAAARHPCPPARRPPEWARAGRDKAAHSRGPDRPSSRRTPSTTTSAGSERRWVRTSSSRLCRSATSGWRLLASGLSAAGAACSRAAASPARKPRRLLSTALPSRGSHSPGCQVGIGRRPQPASAPSITALIMAPCWRASASMSMTMRRCEFFSIAAISLFWS